MLLFVKKPKKRLAGEVRLELTTCGFGDRCSSQLSYFPVCFNLKDLLSLPMQCMLAVKLAKLHLFQTTGGIAFFLGRRIVAPFALGAFQNNQFAHFR